MIIRTNQKKIILFILFQLFTLIVGAYFAHSAYTGSRGLLAKKETKEKIDAISSQIREVRKDRQAWENRVEQLSGTEIDKDLLDERQRAVLNLAHKNDAVILLPKD